MNDEFHDLIKEICEKHNIKYNLISNNWVMVLEKNNIKKFVIGYKFDDNNYAIGKIFDDKYATYELLNLYNIPVVQHSIVYSLLNKNWYASKYNNMEYINKLFNKYNKDIVIKKNTGSGGKNVKRFSDLNELEKYYKNIKSNNSYSITPFYEIENEYRTIVLNNQIKLMYKKELPIVYGDGKSKIEDLLKKFNYEYFKDIKDERILEKNEKYVFGWKFNLGQGSRVNFEIEENDKNEILKILNKILNNFKIGFCSIDIIKTNNKFMVLEINSGVMMTNLMKENNGKNIAYKIYEEEILNMFGERKIMEHRMKLRNKPFEQIKNNKKNIEMRLYDEKRKQIKEKDIIIFTNIDTNEELKVEVEKLYIFNNFEELYNYFDKKELGYLDEEASYKDMEEYYSKEEQKEYGVVGIRIKKI